jgi:hypothetical protein
LAQETRVSLPVLQAAAMTARELRAAIGEPVNNPLGPPRGGVMRDVIPASESAVSGLRSPSGQVDSPSRRPGWLTARALRELVQKQGEDLSRLGNRYNAIAEALDATVVAYRRNEDANVALFRRAEGPW